jgi:hypothetical protein
VTGQTKTLPARIVTGVAACMVVATAAATAVGFWLSYRGLHDFALRAGLTGAEAWAWPASVDLVIAAGEAGVTISALRQHKDWAAWVYLAVGFAASVTGNVLHVDPAGLFWTRYAVAAVPPVAAMLALAALLRQAYRLATEPAPVPMAPKQRVRARSAPRARKRAQVRTPVTPESAEAQFAPVLAEGRLGVAGVRVIVYAQPLETVLAKLRPGDRVPQQVVGTATSSASGQYSVTISNPAALRSSADDGLVNLQVMAFGKGSYATTGFSRKIVAHGLAPEFGKPVAGFAVAKLRLAPVKEPNALKPPPCGTLYLIQNYGPKWTVVGGVYSTVNGNDMNLTYGTDAHSNIGFAVQGPGGGWSESGSFGYDATGTVYFPQESNITADVHETLYTFGEYGVVCGANEVKAQNEAGGTKTVGSDPPAAHICTPYERNSGFSKANTEAFTFQGGVDLTKTIGISLSANTGNSTTVTLTYTYPRAAAVACGTHDYPLDGSNYSPRAVVNDATNNGNN